MNANVSHQHEPAKKSVPKIQPSRKDLTTDSFSRSIAKNKGTSANHARNHKSKFGNASVSVIADATASSELTKDGNFTLDNENFIADSLAKKRRGKNNWLMFQFEGLSIKLNGQFETVCKICHSRMTKFVSQNR